jgi:radical SAM superfamily enzyme YgiQ (UPF0313 family)
MINSAKRDYAITHTEAVPKQFGDLDGMPDYDEFSRIMTEIPGRALGTLETVARNAGFSNVATINPYHHGHNGNYTGENYSRFFNSDVVGLGAITRTAKQTLQLAQRIKMVNPKIKIAFGGSHFTMNPEEGLQYGADLVCIGECEKTWPEVLETGFDPDKLLSVRGIAFWYGKEIVRTPDRELLTPKEFVHPQYDPVTLAKLKAGVVETSRGCVYKCKQCQGPLINRGTYRNKPIDFVIEERRRTADIGKTVFYTDDNISGNKTRFIELSHAIHDAGLNRGFPMVQITAKSLGDSEIQEALLRMGVKLVCVGYEHVFDSNLKNIGKPCDAEDNNEACKILRNLRIWNHGMLMTGGDDTRESLEYTLQWAMKNLDSAQFFPIGNLHGTPFDLEMRVQGRIIVDGISSYPLMDGHHVIVRADNLHPYEHQVITDNMYRTFYSPWNNAKRLAKSHMKLRSLGLMVYTNLMGGVSKVAETNQHLAHLEFLRGLD